MKRTLIACMLLCCGFISAQGVNSNKHVSYVETSAEVDSLVIPDRIYATILLQERDSKGRISIEELEKRMESALNAAGINIKKQLSVLDLGSDFTRYFLRGKDVSKSKVYQLLVYDAKTFSQVLINLEKVKISNVNLSKAKYSKAEELKLLMKQKAVIKAKVQAENLVKPLGQRIGNAFFIQDQLAPDPTVIYSFKSSRRKSQFIEGQGIADRVEFKKIRISADVKVKFYLY